MAILKSQNAPPAMKEAIVLDLGDIGAQAAKIHMAATARANDIVNGAQARVEELAKTRLLEAAKTGHDEGYERGLIAGKEQGIAQAFEAHAAQLEQLQTAWLQVVTQWESQRVEMERDARQSVLEFALRTAEKLVHRVVEVDPDVVIDQVGAALDLVLSANDVSVRIHPVDRPTVEKALPQLMSEMHTLKHVTLVDDDDISPGGCVVTFGGGRVDARIEQQIERIVDLILPSPSIPDMPEEVAAIKTVPVIAPNNLGDTAETRDDNDVTTLEVLPRASDVLPTDSLVDETNTNADTSADPAADTQDDDLPPTDVPLI